MRLLKQLIFGWDTIIGLGSYLALAALFGEHFNIFALMLAGFCAYAPDLDLVPFLLLRRRLRITVGHWVFGHYPLIVVPLLALVAYAAGRAWWPGHEWFLATLACVAVIGHFVHDSAQRGGFHLLAPLTKDGRIAFTLRDPDMWTHYRLEGLWFVRVSSLDVERYVYSRTREWALGENSAGEVAARVETVSTAQQWLTGALCVALLIHWAMSGFALV